MPEYCGTDYKADYRLLKEELGHEPSSKDDEWWKLSDMYRNIATDKVHKRIKANTPAPVSTVGDIKCEQCGEIFQKRPGKGRAPKTCYKCRGME